MRVGVQRQRGVSIVESLVALVVMSIGMLGIAGLYVESVRSNRTALIRTNAVHLVNDLADRIRANRSGRGAYALDPEAPPSVDDLEADCATTDCQPEELAAYDLAHWYNHVVSTLPMSPNGEAKPLASVEFTAGSPDRYVISVQWVEPGDSNPLTAQVEVQQTGTT